MDELKNCKICGKVYPSNEFANVCPNCTEHNENEFDIIREYLYTHPNASIYEVATNLDITINKIKHFLRDGRIEIVEKDNHFLACQTCGKSIHSGWYCDDCLKQSKYDSNPNYPANSNNNYPINNNPGSSNIPGKGESKINYLSKNKK